MSRELTEKIRRLSATVARLDRAVGSNSGLARPPIGSFIAPTGLMTVSTAAPTSGRVTFLPFDITKRMTVSHVGYRIVTNAAGGTTAFNAGIYADNGDGSAPNTSRQLARTATPDPLTTGTNREAALAEPVTLAPGRYWVASLYLATVAPTTAPTMHLGANISIGHLSPTILWFTGALGARCLFANTQTDLPISDLVLTAGYAEQPPIVVVKRSA